MNLNQNYLIKPSLGVSFLMVLATACSSEKEQGKPNIVILYADDMGYGDLNIQNPDSKIPTPYLDQLARDGMRFTDAHSSSGVCSPSRFALLTGTYHWRRQHNIVNSFEGPFFNDSDITLPQVLRDNGYATGCIGKWHLGWNWEFLGEPSLETMLFGDLHDVYQPQDIEWSNPITGGPVDRGFDYYFGDGTINFPPYAWIENDRILEAPTEVMLPDNIGFETAEEAWEFRPGPRVKGWNPYEVLPTMTGKAVEWINNQCRDQPFFLYFSFTSPHTPIIPNEEFIGKSGAGGYGDFVYQTDWVVGRILEALEENGFKDNTIVIFSSDNGPESFAYQRAVTYDHFSMGDLRGVKVDIWEGGHRVPMIIRWPGRIEPGTVSDKLVSQIDYMATLAAATGITLPEGAAPDSYNFLPTLLGKEYDSPEREILIHNTYASRWAVRQGDWLYMDTNSGEHRIMPQFFKDLRGYTDFDTEGLLFNLRDDPGQRVNLYDQHPDKVQDMHRLIYVYKETGYLVKDD
jgi:arylsulfatase A